MTVPSAAEKYWVVLMVIRVKGPMLASVHLSKLSLVPVKLAVKSRLSRRTPRSLLLVERPMLTMVTSRPCLWVIVPLIPRSCSEISSSWGWTRGGAEVQEGGKNR